MIRESAIKFGPGIVEWEPLPIDPSWILEGNPVARRYILSSAADASACMLFWDCTAGRFNWHYVFDESLYFLEGSVLITDDLGVTRQLGAGDSIYFPAGTSAVWQVETYIRKVAFCRVPMPAPVVVAKRVYRRLKRLGKNGTDSHAPDRMFG